MKKPSLDLLRDVEAGHLSPTPQNANEALRYRAFIRVIGKNDELLDHAKKASDIKRFELTARGRNMLEQLSRKDEDWFDPDDPPPQVAHWISAFKRLCRNVPDGIEFYYSDGELFIHSNKRRLASSKVPWSE